jgi:hypothetical protein
MQEVSVTAREHAADEREQAADQREIEAELDENWAAHEPRRGR